MEAVDEARAALMAIGVLLVIGQYPRTKFAQLSKDQCQSMCSIKQAQCLQAKTKTPNGCGAEFSACYQGCK